MRRRSVTAGLAMLLAAPAWAQSSAAIPPAFDGDWRGTLGAGPMGLRLRLVIADGAATLYSLDQGGQPIPADSQSTEGAALTLGFSSLRGRFRGALNGDRLEGEWTQGSRTPLVFTRGDAAPAPLPPLTQEALDALRAETGSPAIAAMARARGGRSLALVSGVRAAGLPAPAGLQDLWHLGSITKAMTATLVAKLAEQGRVSWDDSLGAVLGQAAPDMRDAYRDATFRHLCSHRAGLQANIPGLSFLRFARENPDPREERLAYARIALGQAPAGAKEETFLYSNSGFVLAGAMLEQKLGKPWEVLIQEHVFAPLGLDSAGFGAPRGAQPFGHERRGNGSRRAHVPDRGITDNPAVLGPAGRVHMRLSDLLVYLEAHRDFAPLLSAESWRLLHAPPFGGDYAMGWVKRGEALWHNGSNTMWYAEVLVDPARGICGAAATNDGAPIAQQESAPRALQGALAAVA